MSKDKYEVVGNSHSAFMVSEALQETFMATKLSCTSPLPWIWVIEALESFKEIDTSLLINLVKRTPEMSNDMGKNAKEQVCLRVLETLFVRKTPDADNVASVPGAKAELDPSKHCEDVLRHILMKASISDLKTAGPEMLEWDVQSFIMNKRSRLPKCHLQQQLKDAIVDCTNPLPASLRERSGLEFGNHSRDGVLDEAVDSDGYNQGNELGGMNTQHVAPTKNLDTFILGNTNGLQENQHVSTVVPAKRSIDVSTAYETEINGAEAITENSSDPCAKPAKKFKQDFVSPIQNTVPDLMLSEIDGFAAETCEGSQPVVLKGQSEDEAQVGGFKTNRCLKDGGAAPASSKSVLRSSDCTHNEFLPQRMNADKKFQNRASSSSGRAELGTSSGLSQPVIQQDSHTHGSKQELGCILPQDLQNGKPSKVAKENIAQSHASGFYSDSDEYHDENIALAAQKIDLLNSQYAQGEDSLATVDFSELNLCVKCNEGGKLLVCNSDTCPLVVHESCLGSMPHFDDKGLFYCPFCAYSRAIFEYLESKKNVSLSRKDLAAFIDLGARQSKKSLPKSQGTKPSQSQQDKNERLSHRENGRNSLNEVTGAERNCVEAQVMQMGSPQPEVSVPEQCLVDGQQRDKSPLRCHISEQNQSREEEELCHKENRMKKSLEKAIEAASGPVYKKFKNTELMQMHPPKPLVPRKRSCQGSSFIEESSEEEDETGSRYCVQYRNPKQDTVPLSNGSRKKKLHWTKIEEETLKEGVQRFSSFPDRWKKILEFGCDIFQKGRTPTHLYDKWRSINKGKARAA